MPAEFFHPAVSASQKGQEKGAGTGTLPKIALQGSWASLRSPSVNCTLLRQVRAPSGLQELPCRGYRGGALKSQVELEGQAWGRRVLRVPFCGWETRVQREEGAVPASSAEEAGLGPGCLLIHDCRPQICARLCAGSEAPAGKEYKSPVSWGLRFSVQSVCCGCLRGEMIN